MTLLSVVTHPLTALVIGAAITWYFAWRYYKKAGDELRQEADRLYKISHLILRWLEHNGQGLEIVRDQNGQPKAIRHNVDLEDSVTVGFAPTGGSLRAVIQKPRT